MNKQTKNRCIQCIPPFILTRSSSTSSFSQKNQQWCLNFRGLKGRARELHPKMREGGAEPGLGTCSQAFVGTDHASHVFLCWGFTSASNWTLTTVCSPFHSVDKETETCESYIVKGHTASIKQSHDSNPVPGVSKIHLFPIRDDWALEGKTDTSCNQRGALTVLPTVKSFMWVLPPSHLSPL